MPDMLTENTAAKLLLPKNSNLINYSVLNEFYSPSPFRSFSIKYVVDGSELYSVNGKRYIIRNREYLLANKFSEGFVEVDSKKSVTGICIDVAPDILSEVAGSYLKPDTAISDIDLDRFFNSPDFLENKYNAGQTHLGNFMLELETVLQHNPSGELNLTREFYYTLSEKIVADHIPVFKQFQQVKALKTETKKDLLRKLYKAKEYMDLFFTEPLNIEQVARQAGFSEYHFFRLFKATFSISPHQYIIQQRLKFAKQLLEKERPSISVLAITAGFADIYSFSKAFKKQFGHSPSALLTQK
jgi:AraC family transcriptional regulator